jgi:orotate phosphoribosyltransferase
VSAVNEKLVYWLFETKAVRVCPKDKPFWYTSGKIGPYYINTHFLYGSEEKANEFLKIIDKEKGNKLNCPSKLLDLTKNNYKQDGIYKGLIDEICLFIKNNIDLSQVNYISGGERRDWFFSLVIADILGIPHITIYKDLSTVMTENGTTHIVGDLKGKKVLHIADLITEASSYGRAWIPAIRNRGGILKWSVVVVDRKQGGAEYLESEGVKSFSMVNIDKNMFDSALSRKYISSEQHLIILNYLENPDQAMRSFIIENPDFLKNALVSDDKTKERAQLCIKKNLYNLP